MNYVSFCNGGVSQLCVFDNDMSMVSQIKFESRIMEVFIVKEVFLVVTKQQIRIINQLDQQIQNIMLSYDKVYQLRSSQVFCLQ